ncbi:MAG: argininosuccinate lyase [Bacteroidetes bacterium]|nr:argininosuccinate lyase [Bacteroidota bacterium]MDA0860983.1 argininosuccinate lyase [Bacteroidota bacterium]MDA1318288.1 argininosuccinate lyase [Bacteroidota bacterium]
MKLWDKGFSIDKTIEAFTIGDDREIDLYIAQYDLQASLAHAKMLAKIGILDQNELLQIEQSIQHLQNEVENKTFKIEDDFEDVHSKIEFELIQRLGDAGKKIHTARSRNDQVLVALQLYYKDNLMVLKKQVRALFDTLLNLAEQYKSELLPGYTHLQVAMPSSFGLWFSAYAEALIDDVILLQSAQKIVNQNPLGSAAGYGSSFPIDREMTTNLLNFSDLKYNVVAAQMMRGKNEQIIASALGNLAFTLSKFAMDICLYMSQNFDFISFPENLTTGSSIMPHKKNPDVFELIRGKCNSIQGLSSQIQMMTNNLPSGYHRDFQLLKSPMVTAFETLKTVLSVFDYGLQQVEVKSVDLKDEKYKYLFTVDSINSLVQNGATFREAYQIIGAQVQDGSYKCETRHYHTHIGGIDNLALDKIKAKFPNCY